MSGITRCILRYGLIGGLAVGGVTLLVGPERVAAGLSQVRVKAQQCVDGYMDDPIALRRQLGQLADEYPSRIEQVSGEIAAVDQQIKQFERDVSVAKKVVALTTEDLGNLKTLVARAEAESSSKAQPVAIRYDGVRFDIDEAYAEGRRINHIRTTTMDRLAHDEFQLDFLGEQRQRLNEILEQLKDEYGTYQAQLWQLDRQIDSIERNDRLIAMTEAQRATLESYERFGKVHNLKQLEAKLAELRARQEAQLKTLERHDAVRNYERDAQYEIETNDVNGNPFTEIHEIEMTPKTDESKDGSMVWLAPIVVE